MKITTLIIHPEDKTTDFLKSIYANISEATIITSGTKEQVNEEIKNHDRIIMMGHGSPYGLFSVGRFINSNGYVIDHTTVNLLRGKENIFIWCNADKFVRTHQLEGFYSGMFISEVVEAVMCGVDSVSQEIVDESNNSFSKWVGEVINLPLNEIYEHVTENYSLLANINPVANYNNQRLYLN
jgi:hypothetical protein